MPEAKKKPIAVEQAEEIALLRARLERVTRQRDEMAEALDSMSEKAIS